MAEIVERADVWTLHRNEPWHPTIAWYARAVGELKAITDVADPRSWRYLANIHGTSVPRPSWPSGATWDACEHFGWYFLPWHRIYLHHFEKIVRATVVALGGPADWALPYWNYDPADPETLALPPEFRTPTLPGPAGTANPLFTTRRLNDVVLPATEVETSGGGGEPWSRQFSSEFVGRTTFGGPVDGQGMGQLEVEPHGSVHVEVGGGSGFMSAFETAARDPIFWLHHSNIDRLWEWWRRQADDQPMPLDDTRWMDKEFTVGTADAVTTMKVREVIATTDAPLGYFYEGLPAPPAPVPVPEAVPQRRGPELAEQPPELVGASDRLRMDTGERTVRIATDSVVERLPRPESPGAPVEVALVLENVTGTDVRARYYSVHVNLPDGAAPAEHADRRAGGFSAFGIVEASRSDDKHSGSGLTFTFDITPIVGRLTAAGEWDPSIVQVTVTPEAGDTADVGDVTIGRIGLYYG